MTANNEDLLRFEAMWVAMLDVVPNPGNQSPYEILTAVARRPLNENRVAFFQVEIAKERARLRASGHPQFQGE